MFLSYNLILSDRSFCIEKDLIKLTLLQIKFLILLIFFILNLIFIISTQFLDSRRVWPKKFYKKNEN